MRRLKLAASVGVAGLAVLLGATVPHTCTIPNHDVAVTVVSGSGGAFATRHNAERGAVASIRGTVTDSSHVGIAHASVCAGTQDETQRVAETRDPRCTTTTDHGTYELVNLLPAEYVMTALAERHLPGRLESFDLHAGERRDNVDLSLEAGGVLVTGTVVDLGGGPISHAQVRAVSSLDYEPTAMVETNDSGAFRMTLWPGSIGLYAVADGYSLQYAWGTSPGDFAVVLTPESTISGTVVDSRKHAPVAEAVVELYPADGSREASGKFDVTDEHGRFHFGRLDANRYAAVARASHGYGRSNGSVRVGLGQHVDDMVVMLEPAVNVVGKVLVQGTPPRPCEKPGLYLWRDDRLDWSGQADGGGRMHVDGVLPGNYKVSPRCDSYDLVGEAPTLEISDHDVTGLEWTFAPEAKGTIRGRVLDESGSGVAGARVSLQAAGIGFVTTGREGSYAFVGVHAGSYQIHVDSPSGVTPEGGWNVEVTAGGTVKQDLRLHTGGSIVVTVIDKTGDPVAGATVAIADSTLTTAKDGTVRVDNLVAKTHHVLVDGSTADSRMHDVQVRAGQVSTIKITADQHVGEIRGIVNGADSQPRGDVFVVASLEYGGMSESHGAYDERFRVLTRVDGTFSISGLTPGMYGVRAYESGGGEAILDHVKPGASVTIQIKPTGSMSGIVRAGDGTPDDITVRISDARTNLIRREHFYRTAGHYHFDDLPAGTYQITASDGEREGMATAELADGAKLAGIDLKFDGSVTLTGRVIDAATKLPIAGLPVSATLEGGRSHHSATEQDGRFSIRDVPAGTLNVEISSWAQEYSSLEIKRDCTGPMNLGDLVVAKRRYKHGDKLGRFGITFANDSLRLVEVDPTGPAGKAEIVVGDVVTAIDGIDLAGVPVETAWSLFFVPVGTAVHVRLARGAAVTMVAIPR